MRGLMRSNISKWLVIASILALIMTYYGLGLQKYFSLEFLKAEQQDFEAFYRDHGLATLAAYFVIYTLATALSFPGATVLTLAGGALFGLGTGLLIISFASTIGATLAFLATRFLVRDFVEARWGDRLQALNEGVRREGAFYLFTLRLMPVFPFFLVNLLMGLTPMRTRTFYWVSQLGMLPGTLVYVNAGTQLARIESLAGLFTPQLIVSLTLIGVLPLISRRILNALKARRALAAWPRPQSFDYNIIVIGAGAGGLVSAYIAAALKAKVLLIEKNAMGGDCLNTGCVPSKAFIKAAQAFHLSRRAHEFGFQKAHFEFNFADVMERVQRVIESIAPHDSEERYRSLGVECIRGEARVESPYMVSVNGRRLTARNLILATGGAPKIPEIEGLEGIRYFTSETIWELRTQPRKLLIIGGGPIGCELAQAFQRLGSQVCIVEAGPTILGREDLDVSRFVTETLTREGVNVITGAKATRFVTDATGPALELSLPGGPRNLVFDEVLFALGRKARTEGFGLEELGVRLAPGSTIEHDAFLRTNIPNIYCVGDVAGPYQLTHFASHQAWHAAVNSLFSPFKAFPADYRVIPRVTFTDPEVASVGLTEREAKEKGIAYELTTYDLSDLDRALIESEARGFIKVLTAPGKDKILGATIVGSHAGEYFIEFVTAMKHGLGLNAILGTIHAYPTLAEANKYAAGVWKKAHAPEKVLRWLEKFHRWRR